MDENQCLKKNQNAPRPSEHPPVMGKKMSNTKPLFVQLIVFTSAIIGKKHNTAGRPGSSEVPRNPLTRWDVSSIPANGIFLTKKNNKKIK